MNALRRFLAVTLSFFLVLATFMGSAVGADEPGTETPVTSAQPTQQELQQLVAPIALYPDSLVAQILAGSTYPAQVVEADRWLQEHKDLQGEALAQAVDKQEGWDPSIKALAEFPSVLANMDKNLSWTSSLGDAYINHQQEVMNAVQQMRQQAKQSGNLKSTSEINVKNEGQTIVIEPVDPQVVYVPEYDPWLVYGVPVAPWPGWYWYPGLYWTSPGIAFGLGFGIGFFGGYGWGWHHWGYDWHHHGIIFNHNTYISHSTTFVNRNYYANRGRINSSHGSAGGFHAVNRAGPATRVPHTSVHNGGQHGAFGGFHDGGMTRGYSSRGLSSMGGFHGGGAFHGGGGFHGGGRR